MQVFYQVEEWDQVGDYYECESAWSFNSCADVAADCARDVYENHDGWESKWPLNILIFEAPLRESLKGRFSVEMEAILTFYAEKIE